MCGANESAPKPFSRRNGGKTPSVSQIFIPFLVNVMDLRILENTHGGANSSHSSDVCEFQTFKYSP